MSSILDALKKSERQRSLGRDLVFRNASSNATPRLTGFAVAVLATLLLLALAIGALLFSLRDPVLPPLASTSAEKPAPPTVSGSGTVPEKAMPVTGPAPATRTESVPALDSQAHARIQSPPLPEKPARTRAPASADASRQTTDSRPVTGSGSVEAPWLSSLPLEFRSSLPPLAVNIHVYSPDESQRILYINNRQALQGKKIEAGVVVVEIVPDGVILEFHGQRFKLPRPS